MIASLTIIHYKKYQVPAAFFMMALFRLPLGRQKNISFFKLMGSGKDGGFSKQADLRQWAIFAVHNGDEEPASIKELYGSFVTKWLHFFGCSHQTYLLQHMESHGQWDGRDIFGTLPTSTVTEGPVAVLTRATIRPSRLKAFWHHVPLVNALIAKAPGLLYSIGVGEMPLMKQATFSIWESTQAMMNFAYQTPEHLEVIRKTRQEGWYSEELFARFKLISQF